MATKTQSKTALASRVTGPKWVYLFSEGNANMRDLLGGKGAGVAEMTRIGLPVPPGFTITTEACLDYFAKGQKPPKGMWEQVLAALKTVERKSGRLFGSPDNPLLVSVRSGARFSMPGMMDTVLNIGLTRDTLQGFIQKTNNPRLGWDAYRRLVQMFGRIVLDVPAENFESVLTEWKERKHVKSDTDLNEDDLQQIVEEFKRIIRAGRDIEFPEDPHQQLRMAVMAVFDSWYGRRAVDYRHSQKISDALGTAVNVQMMVFGNTGNQSATGVAFTRNPSTGEKAVFGEYLLNAQGEDVVAGVRTPQPIERMKAQLPKAFGQFMDVCAKLEKHYKDLQDVEFTIEEGKLWMLQTRSGKRTAQAAVKVAVDMAKEKLITRETAVMRVEPVHVDQLLHARFDDKTKAHAKTEGRFLGKGLNASPGAATGEAVFDADLAAKLGSEGRAVILVRPETNPDDVHGMLKAKGILTQHGGATSHAAVVARGLGLPCVAGCEDIKVDMPNKRFTAAGKVVQEGAIISIDGATGEVFAGALDMTRPAFEDQKDLQILLGWADGFRRLGVWANADYPRDAVRARTFGAEGIGLCRTEHMFFEEERLPIVRRMILAKTDADREQALKHLLPFQRSDFEGIFKAMDGLPVIIRLIDPPLHEFLPSHDELMLEVARLKIELALEGVSTDDPDRYGKLKTQLLEREELLEAVNRMREQNPMLGLRGCRLGIIMPGITQMQVRAIFEAAINVTKKGVKVHPEIMIPLVGYVNELKSQRTALEAVAQQVMKERKSRIPYKFGTMIELPRAAMTANQIAEYAEFFSFGTNDLTQTTCGFSRDDAEEKFLLKYVEDKILPVNPFQTLDREGVGQIMSICVEKGRAVNPKLEIGICGEHGGDPSSIEFCHGLGLNYVSCSPFRVPVARLAAAQAALGQISRDR
ncbi:MAG: pyruvate, phosphate dikinase [Chloroflexi bacterium]|nr:pyruvate, phosphate dikinase [Chloroflexota bacterium]